MAAARNGSAMKMRRSTPIFHTVRQDSPSDGGGSTGMSSVAGSGVSASGERLATLGGQHLLAQRELLVATPGRFAEAQCPRRPPRTIGTAKKKNGARQVKRAARPAPRRTPMMMPKLMPERWAE